MEPFSLQAKSVVGAPCLLVYPLLRSCQFHGVWVSTRPVCDDSVAECCCLCLLQMDLPILVKRTLASLMAHLGANTSSLPQARTDVFQPSSCTTHKVMLRNLLNNFAASIRIAARHHSRPDLLSHSSLCLWVHNWSVAVKIEN